MTFALDRLFAMVTAAARPAALAAYGLIGALVLLPAGSASAQTYAYLSQFGSCGSGNGQFYQPTGVAIDPITRRIAVTDDTGRSELATSPRVQIFTAGGTYVSQFGSVGSGNGQFYYPDGIAIDPTTQRIVVTDAGNHRVQIFNANGGYLSKFGSLGGNPGQFNTPLGVAIDPTSHRIVVVDSYNSLVRTFDSSGSFLSQFGIFGSGNGAFNRPNGVAIDPVSHRIVVADTNNNRVQVFSSAGGYLGQFGSSGYGNGQFNRPIGVAIDPTTQNIFVTDWGNNRVQIFNASGEYLSQFGAYGFGNGQLLNPEGIAIDPTSRNVVVADGGNCRVQIFAPPQPSLVVTPIDGVYVTKDTLAASLLAPGSAINITNVTYTGANAMSGNFTGGASIIGIASGILLTSGSATNVVGPNDQTNASTELDGPGDSDLDKLAGAPTFDASSLTLTFVPTGNQIQLSYVFGSEEYNEYIANYSGDAFGLFVNGVNRALVPNTSLPVGIPSVNCGATGVGAGPNCALFVNNSPQAYNTQLDGLTVVLTATATVTPNVPNTLKIAIADGSDAEVDSAIFIAAGSLTETTVAPTGCTPTLATTPDPLTSAGGTVQLNVTGCSPATGLSYNWWRNGVSGWRTTQNPTDLLPPNNTVNPVTTSYRVQVCIGTACTDLLPATALTAVVPPPSVPTGCTPVIATTPSPVTSAGGSVQLNVTGCSPATGLSYNWSRNGTSAWKTTANPTDTLPVNSGASPVTTTYQVTVCNGTACTGLLPATPLAAVVPAGMPTGCTPTLATTPNPLTSAGGSVQLNVTGCSPATGLSYNWSRNGTPGWKTIANPTDALPENSSANPVTTSYQVRVCNGTACTALLPAPPLTAVVPVGIGYLRGNYQGLWWNHPPDSEPGWGLNFAHQGDIIFATWFTFGLDGKPLWMVVAANKVALHVYSGKLYTGTGPAFSAVPFDPTQVHPAEVGSATFTFADDGNATFAYTVNGVAQTKTITREVFSSPVPICTWGGQPNLALATNYQDIWWAAPANSESGWGVNFNHQGDTIFATWFTYGLDGQPTWFVVAAERVGANAYAGKLYTGTGPPYNAAPFDSTKVKASEVGSATLTFTDGNHATFAATVNGVTQTKPVTRQMIAPPGTICQ